MPQKPPELPVTTPMSIGQIAYEEWCYHHDTQRTFMGEKTYPHPKWEYIPEAEKSAWYATAQRIMRMTRLQIREAIINAPYPA